MGANIALEPGASTQPWRTPDAIEINAVFKLLYKNQLWIKPRWLILAYVHYEWCELCNFGHGYQRVARLLACLMVLNQVTSTHVNSDHNYCITFDVLHSETPLFILNMCSSSLLVWNYTARSMILIMSALEYYIILKQEAYNVAQPDASCTTTIPFRLRSPRVPVLVTHHRVRVKSTLLWDYRVWVTYNYFCN